MKRPVAIQKELAQISTVEGMVGVFEAIASIHIAKIRDHVVSSTSFFGELWQVYRQLRREGGPVSVDRHGGRPAVVVITSDSGLIGDIDERIVTAYLANPHREQADLHLIGNHGAALLARHGVRPLKVVTLPSGDEAVDLSALAAELQGYRQTTVYYQKYVSLTRQEVGTIELVSGVEGLAAGATASGPTISSRDYIFEPSFDEVVHYMESVMLRVVLEQVALESRLAQYASRFNTMTMAKTKAHDLYGDLRREYNRSRRWQDDERSKEVASTLAAARRHTA